MGDLSATHRNNRQTTPTLEYGCAVARALAALHAHWRSAERLRAIGGAIPGERELTRYIEHIRPGLQPLLASVGDDIDSSSQQALLDVFDRHPAEMLQRTYDTAGFTLVHGDVNPGNILSPLDGPGKTYLVDRQPFDWSLTTWLGVNDIAYMIVHWWPTELRRQWEFLILRAYHTSLDQRGVRGYSWERLVDDYRLTAVQSLYVATEWCVLEADRTSMRWVWFPQLQKALAAYFDLYR
jgi:thiamine kinase-like enzyme